MPKIADNKWDSTQIFDGKKYSYAGWDITKASAQVTANRFRKKGHSARITKGKDSTGHVLYRIWIRAKR